MSLANSTIGCVLFSFKKSWYLSKDEEQLFISHETAIEYASIGIAVTFFGGSGIYGPYNFE